MHGATPRPRGEQRITRVLVVLPLLATPACTMSTEVLNPAPEPMPDRLLPLTIGLAHEIEVRSEHDRGVTVQTDVSTVFRRDLEANVFSDDTLRWGYVELRVTFDEEKVTGAGVAVAVGSFMTLLVPTLLGAPFTIEERTLQSELTIYDSRRVPVRTYVFDGRVKYPFGIYNKESARRESRIEAAKQVMRQFRDRLAAELGDVNGRLRRAGPIAGPAPGPRARGRPELAPKPAVRARQAAGRPRVERGGRQRPPPPSLPPPPTSRSRPLRVPALGARRCRSA